MQEWFRGVQGLVASLIALLLVAVGAWAEDGTAAVQSFSAQLTVAAETPASGPSAAVAAPTARVVAAEPTLVPATSVPAAAAVPIAPTAAPVVATAVPATAIPATAVPPAATAVAPPPTPVPVAATAVPAPQVDSYTERGLSALAQVGYPPSRLGYSISFLPPRQGYRGLTFPYENRIEVYVSNDLSDSALAHVIAHEIGHAVDVVLNSPADRDRWLAARGVSPNSAWWAGSGVSDFASGSGDFAECFAVWRVGGPSYSRLAGSCDGTAALVAELAAG